MTQHFEHGYALLIGVGESAYPKWSLPVTVKDMQFLRATPTDVSLCGYPDDDAHIRLQRDSSATRQAILDAWTGWLNGRLPIPAPRQSSPTPVTAGWTRRRDAITWFPTVWSLSTWSRRPCQQRSLPAPYARSKPNDCLSL